MAQGTTPNAAFQRLMIQRGVSQRDDDLWSYLDEPGYKRELGSATTAPNSTWSNNTGSGSVTITGMGGSSTSSDPGGYNYRTLSRGGQGIAGAVGEAYNFLAERREINRGELDYTNPNKRVTGFRVRNTPLYDTYRGKQKELGTQQRRLNIQAIKQQGAQQQAAQQAAKQQAQQKQQQFSNFAAQTIATSRNLAAGVQAKKGKPKPGASSPMPRGGSPKPGPVNLLTGPTALGQPTKKPRSARGTVQTPKANRPSINTYDPSIW